MRPDKGADLTLVEHMLACIEAIDEYLAGDSRRYLSSRLVRDAVLRNLQTMTESSQRLSPEIKVQHPEIPWRKLAGFRNLLVHDYLGGIDDQAVVLIFNDDIPKLRDVLVKMKAEFVG